MENKYKVEIEGIKKRLTEIANADDCEDDCAGECEDAVEELDSIEWEENDAE